MGHDVGGLKPRRGAGSAAMGAPEAAAAGAGGAFGAGLRAGYLRQQLERIRAAGCGRSHAAAIVHLLDVPDPIGGTGDHRGASRALGALSMPDLLATLAALDRSRHLGLIRARMAEAGDGRARIEAALAAYDLAALDPAALSPDRLGPAADTVGRLRDDEQRAVFQYLLDRRGVRAGAEEMAEGVVAMLGGVSPGNALPQGVGPLPDPIEPGAWRPPGDEPIPMYIGNEAHREIAEHYRAAHEGQTMYTNHIPLATILKMHPERANAAALSESELAARPDIANLTRMHLYEIKPLKAQAEAIARATTYVALFTRAGLPMTLGPTGEPGTSGAVSAPAGVYVFSSPEPGVIVYEYRRGRLEPVPVVAEEPETVRRWRFQLKPLSREQMTAITGTMTTIMLILLVILLAPVGA